MLRTARASWPSSQLAQGIELLAGRQAVFLGPLWTGSGDRVLGTTSLRISQKYVDVSNTSKLRRAVWMWVSRCPPTNSINSVEATGGSVAFPSVLVRRLCFAVLHRLFSVGVAGRADFAFCAVASAGTAEFPTVEDDLKMEFIPPLHCEETFQVFFCLSDVFS